jgi:hypothetical protein
VFHEMNLSCTVLTLHDTDPKLILNDFCRSQERQPPCLSRVLTAPPQALDTGVRPIRQHSGWPSHPISISRSRRKVPALSDRGDEQCGADRQHHHHRKGPSPARSDAAAPLWGEKKRDSWAAVLGQAAAGDSLAGRARRTCHCRWAPTHSCCAAGWQ